MTPEQYCQSKLEIDELQLAVTKLIADRAPTSDVDSVAALLRGAIARFEEMLRNATPNERRLASAAMERSMTKEGDAADASDLL